MSIEQKAPTPPAFYTVPDGDLALIAERFGTPLLVINEATLLGRLAEWNAARRLEGRLRVFYAAKALSLIGLLRLLKEHGLGVEAGSLGEYEAARRAGVPAGDILYQGSPKLPDEAREVLARGVRAVIVDSPFEIPILDRLAKGEVPTLIRLNPGKDAHTHDYLATAREDSKFGVLPGEELKEAVGLLLRARHLRLVGFHVHVGSELRRVEDYDEAYRAFAEMVAEAVSYGARPPEVLDVGGGLGVRYSDEETLDAETFVRLVQSRLGHLEPAEIWVEPGRSIVSEAGILLYRVVGVKERPELPFAFIDGGMGDNIRPALYGAQYPLKVVGAREELAPRTYRVVGRYCESGDILRRTVELPRLYGGELLALASSGAYTYAMSSHYNGVGRPAVVLRRADGTAELWARRETVDDLFVADVGAAGEISPR